MSTHHAEIYRYLRRATGRASDADDLAQETFLRAFRAYRNLPPDANSRAWLFAIATNLSKNHYRAQSRRRRAYAAVAHEATEIDLGGAPDRATLAVFAIPQALEAGETIGRLKALNPAITVLARAHSEGQVRHLLAHGADAAVLAERELAYSLAEMVMATPPYRPARA